MNTREYSKQWTTELFQTEDSGEATLWSSNEDEKFENSQRSCGTRRYSNRESQREESQRWEESGRMLSVESKWTMFERRDIWFPSRTRIWKQMRGRDEKNFRSFQFQKRRHRLTGRYRAQIFLEETVRILHVTCAPFRTSRLVEVDGQPSKVEKWWERFSCFVKGVYRVRLSISRFLSEKTHFMERRDTGIKSYRQILQGNVELRKIGKIRVHRRESIKSVHLMSAIRALPDLRKEHKTKLCIKKMNLTEEHGIWRNKGKATFCSLVEARATPAPISKYPKERDFVGDCEHQCTCSAKGFELRRNGDSAEIQDLYKGGDG